MTEELYLTDSYLREFDAVVTAVEGQAVALDRTALYPGGGGQPHDLGLLTWEGGTARVTKVKRRSGQIWHTLEGDMPTEGTPVHGALDWQRRYQLMRTHTALHVLCGVVWRDYGALVTGGNMEPLKGRMDFEFETMHKELVSEIEATVNAEIAKDHPVRVAILPREEAFQIPDLIRTKINLLPPHIQEVSWMPEQTTIGADTMFRPVPSQLDFVKQEREVLDFWKRTDAFGKLREKNKGHATFSFIDGPITANNPMGVHHAWGRTYKDVFQRYRAMCGFDERWQNGFDCQGLWVEVEVEKERGFCHALVHPLRYGHQPARNRHRGLPGADPPQRLSPLPAPKPARRGPAGVDHDPLDADQ